MNPKIKTEYMSGIFSVMLSTNLCWKKINAPAANKPVLTTGTIALATKYPTILVDK